ncbi:ras association domain-containing protein 5 isoform X1 [Platichthys flesus]|uniref:ras association domain-containing protein 5 isoform X1 n=1 Tax=Platichthys flesus TaxID=8260 RepID=UPI002DBA8272|nr:ras association domain-containing protein 5 isoform X1 [Platichthys flesus]
MASASVVGQHPGQHRLDSDQSLFVFKLTGVRKKITPPRKASREKLMFRRRSGSGGESGSVPGVEAAGSQAGEAEPPRGGMMPGEGHGAAPRSPDREDSSDRPGARDSETRLIPAAERNIPLDSNQNTGGRRGASLKRSGITVMHSDVSCRHRDRESRNGDSGHESSSSSVSAPGDSGGLPRLTQARSGVVRLARLEPSRREAWSIFPQGLDPRVRTEKGEGHRFESKPVTQDWCDACSHKITAQALKCQNCSYTCHLECQRQVQLDCNQRDRQGDKTPSPSSIRSSTGPQHKPTETKEEEEGGTKELSAEEVRTRIEEYNAQVTENGMKLASDGSFTGFIKVHLRLSRPVTVPSVEAAGSEGAPRQTAGRDRATSEEQEETDCGQIEKRTSFYLPSDCVKQLHIRSQTTTREVIQALLKKFMVLDNPSKFALYRQMHRDGQDLFQKLTLCERPLLQRLVAGPEPEQLTFVLKEKETGEVQYHAFSVTELQNFLVFLGKEEAERVRAVGHKYAMYRQKLQQALRQHDP